MEMAFKVIPLAIAGWNAAMNRILKWKKIQSQRVLDAIVYYSIALSLMGFFDMDTLKELINVKGAA